MSSTVLRVPEKILAYKPCREGSSNEQHQYLVKFRGQSHAHALWLTKSEINNEAMVHLYRQSAKLDEPIPSSSSSTSSSSIIATAMAAATAAATAIAHSLGGSATGGERPKKERKEGKNEVRIHLSQFIIHS